MRGHEVHAKENRLPSLADAETNKELKFEEEWFSRNGTEKDNKLVMISTKREAESNTLGYDDEKRKIYGK